VSNLDCIRQTIARYEMLHAGDSVGVAVSGGADSVCLLHVLLRLRSEFALRLAIIHVDHNLRGVESQADAQFVHNYAQQLGLPFHLRTLDLGRRRGNLEQAARDARYEFFHDLIREGVVQRVATGHTRSDQAETVLYRLLRGAGSAGLAGIRPVTDSGVIRPLLEVTRLQVETWLQERAIPWRQDATNRELRFDRNRIRHQLLPMLEAEWNPGVKEALAQTADWAQEEEQYWRSLIRQLATADWVRFAKNAAVLDATRLNSLPVAVARRLTREIVQRVKGDLLGVSFAHIEAIRELALGARGEGRQQIAGLEVFRSFNWVRFVKSGRAVAGEGRNWQFDVTAPGRYVVPPITIELELLRNNGVYNGSLNALDGERVCGPLVLRNWRAGDEYRRQGHVGVEKVKKLFQEHRIPLWERQNWPIITVGSLIAWASQFGPAAEFAVNADSRTVLRIHESRENYEAEKV
jgi:tRNA(Ile)-lysidine synthase